MSLVGDLFNGVVSKLKRRDTSTVRRSKLDDGVFDAMRERAKLLRATIENPPKLDADGEKNGEYVPHWDDLVGDVYKSLHTHEDPGVLEPEQIKPSREANRRVMQHVINSEHFEKTRPLTRHAEIESAFATIGMVDELRDTLQNEMKELAEEAKEAEKHEKQIERQEEKAEELRQQIREQGGKVAPQQQETLEDAVKQKYNAQSRLGQSIEQMQEIPVTVGTSDSIEKAAKQAKEDAQLIVSLPGVGPGDRKKLSPDEALRLAQMFKENPRLASIAEMLGRLLRDMRFKRARRITGGHEETVDVTLGSDLEHILPSEGMKLMDDAYELDFMRRFHENALLQYELQGTEEVGYGPLIVCRDESKSMTGQRNVWAAAISLALIAIARKERRDAAVVAYSSSSQQTTWVFKHGESFDPERIVEMTSHFFNGGTDATPAIREAVRLTKTDIKYTKADLVLISDGEDRYQDDDKRLRDELTARGVRISGVMIADTPSQYLREMCDYIASAYDLAGANDATDMLAENIS